ncbi:50S ribosomal protein L32 [Candidatus Levyibacteriota bacterium]|nr:50S ribosomal protein L32 [Candidatus Levybacteria bacterium]GDX62135.1 50S ribosomal protein L32 [Candidatus Levybacteria bacterium]
MPQEPKKRHSRARQGKRRASIFFTAPKGITCKNCTSIILPHTVCVKCGFYEGRKIIDIKNKLAKTA